jgi:PTS system nitrogen regulatory IIA component
MQISDILSPKSVVSNLKVTSKKQALQELSKRISDLAELEDRDVFEILLDREKLGTTGVGNGIAIPHGKMENVDKLHGLFARLERPVEFESIDERPVDLIFLLLAPESAGADHLKALAQVSRLLRDKSMCEKLRGSDSPEALYALLTDQTANQAA